MNKALTSGSASLLLSHPFTPSFNQFSSHPNSSAISAASFLMKSLFPSNTASTSPVLICLFKVSRRADPRHISRSRRCDRPQMLSGQVRQGHAPELTDRNSYRRSWFVLPQPVNDTLLARKLPANRFVRTIREDSRAGSGTSVCSGSIMPSRARSKTDWRQPAEAPKKPTLAFSDI